MNSQTIEIQEEQILDQLAILDYMYSKHLVTPSYIRKTLDNTGRTLSRGITVEDLIPFDQDHFGGVNETELCLERLSLGGHCRVLDIGSGLGGPARYIAYKARCAVTGVEIQPDRFNAAIELTRAVKLDDLVNFKHGDFTSIPLPDSSYSHVISLLSILHIIDKKKAIKKIGKVLDKSGRVLIEDYYRSKRLTDRDKALLLETISCPNLMSLDGYIKAMEAAHISIIELTDMNDLWKTLVEERVNMYNDNLPQMSNIYGVEVAINALNFAEGVMKIFQNGLVGGIRILGEKA